MKKSIISKTKNVKIVVVVFIKCINGICLSFYHVFPKFLFFYVYLSFYFDSNLNCRFNFNNNVVLHKIVFSNFDQPVLLSLPPFLSVCYRFLRIASLIFTGVTSLITTALVDSVPLNVCLKITQDTKETDKNH